MESEGSLSCSQELTTGIYPEPDGSSPYPHPISLRSSHLCLCLPSGLFLSGFPTKTDILYAFYRTCAICPNHLILLDFIIIKIEQSQFMFSKTHHHTKTKTKLRGLSPQANYTDRATATVGEVVPTFGGRGCYVVRATDSHGR
jgi:hypothetical protein